MSTAVNSIASLQLPPRRPRRKKQLTNQEKRRAVIALLLDDSYAEWSDKVLAAQARVSQTFVSEIRRSLSQNILSARTKKRRGFDGVVRNTSKIGKGREQNQRDLVLSAVHDGFWTIKEIMEKSDLRRPIVQIILDDLVYRKIVVTTIRKNSDGGRPHTLYIPTPNAVSK